MFQKIFRDYDQDKIIVIYKLLHDFLLIWSVFFVFAMFSEGLITGIVSSRLELYVIAGIMLISIFLIRKLGASAKIESAAQTNKKIAWPLFFILGLLIFNSLVDLNIFLNIFIMLLIFVSAYFTFKIFQEE